MAEADNGQPIRILHLSDIHFKASKPWDADPVLRDLADFIGKEVEKDGPDLVAITGDLAFAGTAKEYKLARTWLDTQLWPKLGHLPHDCLVLVPGNHDVDRSKVTKGVRMRQDALVQGQSQDDIADLLSDDDERMSLLKRHVNYMDFVSDWLGARQSTDFPRSLIEFQRRFPDERACAAYLANARWPDGFRCPACGHGRDGSWRRRPSPGNAPGAASRPRSPPAR